MSEGRRLVAIVVLFLIGFGLIGLASQVDSTWPLFVTVIPCSVIPWLVVHENAGLRRPTTPVAGTDEG